MTSIYGTLTSGQDVQQAVLGTLQTWILTYLAETERQESLLPRTLTPPGGSFPPALPSYPADSPGFRGGLDFETWTSDQLPLLIVVCQPFGPAERQNQGVYAQWYQAQVAAVVQDAEQEAAAQLLAERYGKAVTGLLTQQGALGTRVDADGTTVPFAGKTVLAASPLTEFVDPANRRYARSVTAVHTLVEQVVDESQGPRVPPADPYALPGPPTTITQVDVTLLSETPAGQTGPATGVQVKDSTGNVIVTE